MQFRVKMRINMQKNATFMSKMFVLLINFSNFASELIFNRVANEADKLFKSSGQKVFGL